MPRLEHLTLHQVEPSIAKATTVIDGVAYELVLDGSKVRWPATCQLAPSLRKRLEPKIKRAITQWRDLTGRSQ